MAEALGSATSRVSAWCSLAASADAIAGHESEPCPLDHPLVGRLRCGEWLLFAGVHDLMHLEQLHGLKEGAGDG